MEAEQEEKSQKDWLNMAYDQIPGISCPQEHLLFFNLISLTPKPILLINKFPHLEQ